MDIQEIIKKLEDIAEPLINGLGYELIDVEFIEEEGERYLTFYIDNENGITVNDCERVSRPLSDKLDEIDPIEVSYYLEVSSPGVNRKIKKDEDFERFKNRKIRITYLQPQNGSSEVDGILKGLEEDTILVDIKGVLRKIKRSTVKSVNLNEF